MTVFFSSLYSYLIALTLSAITTDTFRVNSGATYRPESQPIISFTALATEEKFEADVSTLAPDVVVGKDSSSKFNTIQAALNSLPATTHRVIVYIKDGVYNEKVVINRPNVTLIGASRKGTRIEFSLPATNDGDPARGVLNVMANGIVLQNLTVANTYPHRRHTFALYGRGSFIVTTGCDFIAEGNDTVALWAEGGGMYYHNDCHFQGNIDFLCPRGWCYVTNSTFYEVDTRAALWHDGGKDPRKKLVIRSSTFKGARKFALGRYPRDSQFYLLDCIFSDSTENIIDTNAPDHPTEDFNWGRRVFFSNCHREGGDAPWHKDNLKLAAGSPDPKMITAEWTFGEKWNPERVDAPRILHINIGAPERVVEVVFSEPVTVRGVPILKTKAGKKLKWTGVNGTNTLTFALLDKADVPAVLYVDNGSVFASMPTTKIRNASLNLPRAKS